MSVRIELLGILSVLLIALTAISVKTEGSTSN